MSDISIWQDKYVRSVSTDYGPLGPSTCHKDGWGAVLYVRDSLGHVTSLYSSEEEYKACLRRWPSD